MGLAGVELLMAMEERFGIVITDHDAMRVTTVADMQRLITQKLHPPSGEICLSSHVFYRIRKALMTLFDVPRVAVQLDRRVAELIPLRRRQAHWQHFAEMTALSVPELTLPGWLLWTRRGLILAAGLTFPILLLFLGDQAGFGAFIRFIFILLFGALPALFLWAVLAWVTTPLTLCIPRSCETISGLVTTLVAMNYPNRDTPASTLDEWPDDYIWEVMTEVILAECKGPFRRLVSQEITPEAKLWQDICPD